MVWLVVWLEGHLKHAWIQHGLCYFIITVLLEKIGPWVPSSFGVVHSVDFMKSGGFHGHEIWQISNFMKSGGFHGHEIWQISNFMKSSGFHG